MSLPISGFTAIPNPQMLAFMPIQSYLMMYFAGAGWQIGKRKISAIPNDQFNKMSANDLLKGFTADLRETIPTLESSMQDITPLVNILVKQYGDFAREIINVIPQVAQNVAGSLVNPKGALVPPLFGAELERFVSGNPTQSQMLAYVKILLQQEADKRVTPPNLGLSGTEKEDISAHQKRLAEQAIQTKQNIRDQRIIEAKKRAAERSEIRDIKPQLRRGFTSKRPAGQSQRMERTKLINQINIQRDAVAERFGHSKNKAIVALRISQQLLANLLARYRF